MSKNSYGISLSDRILQIDHVQARRFNKLSGEALNIAIEGILRHLRACAKMDVNPDGSAIREIIDDALNGRRVFAESDDDNAEVSRMYPRLGNGTRS